MEEVFIKVKEGTDESLEQRYIQHYTIHLCITIMARNLYVHVPCCMNFIRASVDALYRDGANGAHAKSFHAPRMCEYEPS